jgi:hypothetical protein
VPIKSPEFPDYDQTVQVEPPAAVKGGTLRAEAVIISLTSRTAVVRVDVTKDGTAVVQHRVRSLL